MKEKLLKLIDACIESPKFVNEKSSNLDNFIGLNRSSVKSSYLSSLEYKGENVYFNDRYKCSLKDIDSYTEVLTINFVFEKEPKIAIYLVEIKHGGSITKQNRIGKKHLFFYSKDVEFDVATYHPKFQYEMKCGSFNFVLDDLLVKELYDRIIKKRKDHDDQVELNEINKRLKKYNIE